MDLTAFLLQLELPPRVAQEVNGIFRVTVVIGPGSPLPGVHALELLGDYDEVAVALVIRLYAYHANRLGAMLAD